MFHFCMSEIYWSLTSKENSSTQSGIYIAPVRPYACHAAYIYFFIDAEQIWCILIIAAFGLCIFYIHLFQICLSHRIVSYTLKYIIDKHLREFILNVCSFVDTGNHINYVTARDHLCLYKSGCTQSFVASKCQYLLNKIACIAIKYRPDKCQGVALICANR